VFGLLLLEQCQCLPFAIMRVISLLYFDWASGHWQQTNFCYQSLRRVGGREPESQHWSLDGGEAPSQSGQGGHDGVSSCSHQYNTTSEKIFYFYFFFSSQALRSFPGSLNQCFKVCKC
jgi:hypothetical protein